MLVLSRKNGQKIIINDNIEITILETRFDNCKIAINAPRDVKIFREEVYVQIQLANKMSNTSSVESLDAIDSLTSIKKETLEPAKKINKVIIKKKEQ